MTESDDDIRKVDGRTREAKAARAADLAAAARTVETRSARMSARGDNGRIEVLGRGGEVLRRTTTQVGDEFDVPESAKEPDWDYQWNAVSVAGDSDIALHMLQEFEANGWRAVPSSRFPGRFMRTGTPGEAAIVRKGLMLMERPKVLSEEARQEEYRKAVGQMRDRDQSLMGGKADLRGQLGPGFEMGGKYRGTGGDLRMSIDRALDVPKPTYDLADSSGQ